MHQSLISFAWSKYLQAMCHGLRGFKKISDVVAWMRSRGGGGGLEPRRRAERPAAASAASPHYEWVPQAPASPGQPPALRGPRPAPPHFRSDDAAINAVPRPLRVHRGSRATKADLLSGQVTSDHAL